MVYLLLLDFRMLVNKQCRVVGLVAQGGKTNDVEGLYSALLVQRDTKRAMDTQGPFFTQENNKRCVP